MLDSDRKSTRLNSSHITISYAVFCLKKKTRRIRAHPASLTAIFTLKYPQAISPMQQSTAQTVPVEFLRPRDTARFLNVFFFNDTATTEIYTLSLHDALPISGRPTPPVPPGRAAGARVLTASPGDRKSTRLNSSHITISYAVFCLKKKTD